MKRILIIALAILSLHSILKADIIDKINQNNASITSLVCDAQTILQKRAVTHTVNGVMYFEKSNNFRMINQSAVDGKFTSDIGSNSSYFWFYSKRLRSGEAYFSLYQNLNKTHLKDSLNPLWMIEIIGLNKLPSGKLTDQGNGTLALTEQRTSTRRQQIIKVSIIDPKKPAVVAHYLYSTGQRLLAEVKVLDFFKTSNNVYIPKQVELNWIAEDITIQWTLSNPRLNKRIDPKTWEMPNLGVPRVDLGSGVEVRNVND